MNRLKAIMVIGLLMLGAGAEPVLAAAADAAHESETVNIFSGNLGNALWTLLIFLLVVIVLGKYAWQPILTGLQRREQFIRESLETARKDREAAEARLKEYEQKLLAARDEATALVEEGRRDADQVRRRIEEEAKTTADNLIDRAKREIGAARDSALRDLYEQSAEMATLMAGNVLKRELSGQDHQQLVRDALAQLKQDNQN